MSKDTDTDLGKNQSYNKIKYYCHFSVVQCLTPVLACDGWTITTIEGLGNKTQGYHPIQVSRS
jgi:aerobic-type carbon monoxide dehydrogenase small subunit (CoxS/CutS family)